MSQIMPMTALFFAVLTIGPSAFAGTLNFQITGLRNGNGNVLVSVFDRADGFPDAPEKALKIKKVKAQQSGLSLSFVDLPDGSYAVSFVHDENANDKLDTNAVGIPKEGFGFSRDPKISFGAPSFDAARIEVKGPKTNATAKMNYL